MPPDTPTVVIVNHDGARHLPRCLDEVGATGLPVVVVDNASTDGSADVAERPGVDLVRSPRNLGFAGGVNLALERVATPEVLLLNADVSLGPGYVDLLRGALDDDPALAGATGLLLLPGGAVDSTGIALTRARWAHDRDRGRAPDEVASGAPFGVSGAACLLRAAALRAAGGLWEDLFVYWEDVELAWRLRRAGHGFAFVPEARAVHHRGADTADPTFVEAASFGGRLATVARHEGLAGLLRPASLAVTAVVGARLAVRHPAALRRATPVGSVRAGLAARRGDAHLGRLRDGELAPHPWRAWLAAQLTGGRRGLGAVGGGGPRLSPSDTEPG